ncbi:MAG: hypothetical protein HY261_08740 [Chloroflexi bacterium]|nr:hypothetical protein [Chloroflexota bacterium]
MGMMTNIFAPVGWTRAQQVEGARVWSKVLRQSDVDQSLTLYRLEPGASIPPHRSAFSKRVLVLDGVVEFAWYEHKAKTRSLVAGRGALVERPAGRAPSWRSERGCTVLVAGDPPGAPAMTMDLTADERLDLADVFGPGGWYPTPNTDLKSNIPGVLNKPLYIESNTRKWPDMYMHRQGHSLYAVYFEPGAIYPMHPHPYAQQLLFLAGDMEDQIVEGPLPSVHPSTGSGRTEGMRSEMREYVSTYSAGSFVDYPYPMRHASFSKHGCWAILGT